MKEKKGFTLVELLAVIAILAILVVIALPNVLGMFNTAKSSSFTTEVQTIMDTAKSAFTMEQISHSGSGITFSNQKIYFKNAEGKYEEKSVKPLDLDGNEKKYRVDFDRNGNITRVIVGDNSFCYDNTTTGEKADTPISPIEKTDVKVEDVLESAAGDSVSSNTSETYGCAGKTKAKN